MTRDETIQEAAERLLAKLAEVEEATMGVFLIAQVHGCGYNGPNYKAEKEALRAALRAAPRVPETPTQEPPPHFNVARDTDIDGNETGYARLVSDYMLIAEAETLQESLNGTLPIAEPPAAGTPWNISDTHLATHHAAGTPPPRPLEADEPYAACEGCQKPLADVADCFRDSDDVPLYRECFDELRNADGTAAEPPAPATSPTGDLRETVEVVFAKWRSSLPGQGNVGWTHPEGERLIRQLVEAAASPAPPLRATAPQSVLLQTLDFTLALLNDIHAAMLKGKHGEAGEAFAELRLALQGQREKLLAARSLDAPEGESR